ncbi:MAG: bifunctional oligoribonuclease/PAP phosphatase NrnA [Oscillospiraceae bacterium]|jgi:phosphoesterase RecJ-like protein|nr:bifunctional oligoribonuclease/PAP phosphatase NrnA [Oscillospiraceae bacterium]
MKRIDLQTAASRLLEARVVLILAHSHPDGDTLGSAYALAHALQSLGKAVRVLCEDPSPAMFGFMAEGLEETDREDAMVVSVDVAEESLLGDTFAQRYRGKIDLNIDHHATGSLFAAETLADASAGACAEVVGEVIDAMGVPLTARIAACVYAGISTDTGCFRYANTTARSHRWAARCIDLGVDTEPLDRAFFETETKTYLALERMAFDGLQYFCDGRAAIVAVTQEMFRRSGSNEEEYIKIVARVRNIEGVLVGVAIRERERGGYKISMRTHAPVDAAALCARMGGGGHPRAAGAASDLPLEATVAMVAKYIKEALS